MSRPIITFLTDFGTADHYVAAMKAVILSISPDAQLIDITHEIAPYQIVEAGYELDRAWRYFPAGTVHLVVVDPGVGSARRPILVEAAGHFFVGPDNGVFTRLITDAAHPATVRELTSDRFFHHPVSKTFHGRDIFAPVSAHLANGTFAADFGHVIGDPTLSDLPSPLQQAPGTWIGAALRVDHFGNITTNFDWETFRWVAEEAFELHAGSQLISAIYTSYAASPAGGIFLVCGSSGYLEIAARQQSAASKLNVSSGDSLILKRFQG